jgi:hypothetical protein
LLERRQVAAVVQYDEPRVAHPFRDRARLLYTGGRILSAPRAVASARRAR